MHGEGRMIYIGGESYEGGFKYGKRDGDGLLKYQDGTFFKGKLEFLILLGNFKDNVKNGYGNEFFSDGSEYLGEYKNGTKHGRGVLKLLNGDTYDGEFFEDKCQG